MNHVVNHYELSQEEITAYIILSAFIITDDSDFMKNVIIIFTYENNNINTPLSHQNKKTIMIYERCSSEGCMKCTF